MVASHICASIGNYAERLRLGETYAASGFHLRSNPDTVLAADLSFVRASRLAAVAKHCDGYFPGAPDLAVEVIEYEDTHLDVCQRIDDWLRAGATAVVILILGLRTAAIHRFGMSATIGEEGVLELPDLLTGWHESLRDLFDGT